MIGGGGQLMPGTKGHSGSFLKLSVIIAQSLASWGQFVWKSVIVLKETVKKEESTKLKVLYDECDCSDNRGCSPLL